MDGSGGFGERMSSGCLVAKLHWLLLGPMEHQGP